MIHGTVEDAEDFDRFSAYNIENTIVAVYRSPDTGLFVMRQERVRSGKFPNCLAAGFQFFHKGKSPPRITRRQCNRRLQQITARFFREYYFHKSRSLAMPAQRAFSSSKTSFAGRATCFYIREPASQGGIKGFQALLTLVQEANALTQDFALGIIASAFNQTGDNRFQIAKFDAVSHLLQLALSGTRQSQIYCVEL